MNASRGRRAGLGVAVALLALIPIGVLATCGTSSGRVHVRGGPHGEFTVSTSDCHTLGPYGRFGATLHGDGHEGGAIYVIADPVAGPQITLEVPGSCQSRNGTDCTLIPVPRSACAVFDADVRNTRTVVNDVQLVRGHAELRCTLPDGTHVEGRVEFDGC